MVATSKNVAVKTKEVAKQPVLALNVDTGGLEGIKKQSQNELSCVIWLKFVYYTAEGPCKKKACLEEPDKSYQLGLPPKDVDLIDLCSSSEENDVTATSNSVSDPSLSQQLEKKKLVPTIKVLFLNQDSC